MNALDLEHAESLRDTLGELAVDETRPRRRPHRRRGEGVHRRRGHQVHAGPRRARGAALGRARPRLRRTSSRRCRSRRSPRSTATRSAAAASSRSRATCGSPSSNAKIGQPEIDLGILPGWGGSVRLARTTTLGFAKELIFTGRPVDAAEALEHGLVNAVYEPGELREKTLELCRGLEAKSPLALAYAKEAVNLSLQGPHRTNLESRGAPLRHALRERGPVRGHGRLRREAPARVHRPLDRAREGVAGRRAALFVAAREPAAALLGGAVRPRLRVHLALRLLLDAVVADRRGGVEAGVDVVLRELLDQAGLDRVRRPDAGVAVGLELGAHGPALRPLPVAADALEDAELVLDVVAVLVRDHVRLGERRLAGAEARLELVEEAEVDVDELVARAVEGADLGGGRPAGRLHLVGEEDGVDVRVLLAAALEDAVPELLRAVDDADDEAVLALVRVGARPALLRDDAGVVALPDLLILERRELPEPAAAGEQAEQDIDDERRRAPMPPPPTASPRPPRRPRTSVTWPGSSFAPLLNAWGLPTREARRQAPVRYPVAEREPLTGAERRPRRPRPPEPDLGHASEGT